MVDFQLVMGGLRPFGTEKIVDLKSFLRHHWDEVKNRSGQDFQYDILDNTNFIYDTEPPSRAVVAMRELNPAKEFDFFKEVQRLFYYDNKDTNAAESYLALLDGTEVQGEDFIKTFGDELTKNRTSQDFLFSQNTGVRGFPTTVLKTGDQFTLLAHGYVEAQVLTKRIDQVLESHPAS